MSKQGKCLGIDFGDRRVGIAVSDPGQDIAFPRDFLEYTSQKELVQRLTAFCEEEGIVAIVVGLPIQMSGKRGDRAEKTDDFVAALKKLMPETDIHTFDERLSSQYATKALQKQGIRAKDQKGKRDALSAQIILQNYLNSL